MCHRKEKQNFWPKNKTKVNSVGPASHAQAFVTSFASDIFQPYTHLVSRAVCHKCQGPQYQMQTLPRLTYIVSTQ